MVSSTGVSTSFWGLVFVRVFLLFPLSLVLVKVLRGPAALVVLTAVDIPEIHAVATMLCCLPYPVDVQSAVCVSNVSSVPSIASAVVFRTVSCLLTVVNTPMPPVLGVDHMFLNDSFLASSPQFCLRSVSLGGRVPHVTSVSRRTPPVVP